MIILLSSVGWRGAYYTEGFLHLSLGGGLLSEREGGGGTLSSEFYGIVQNLSAVERCLI